MVCDSVKYEIHPITTQMFPEVHEFLEQHFFPHAPIARSLRMSQRRQFWTWAWVESCLMEEETLVALDQQMNIIGVIIGKTSLLLDMSWSEKIGMSPL